VVAVDPDHELRVAALRRIRELSREYDDLIPVKALRAGFVFRGTRISFGSFFKGIHRPRELEGPAALTLTTVARVPGKPIPYEDQLDVEAGAILYHYRDGAIDQADNRALRAAFATQARLIYFHGIAPGQYVAVAPVFVVHDDPAARCVYLQQGLPDADLMPGDPISTRELRAYALRDTKIRLHQHRFRVAVLHAYRHRCAICALRERDLVQAAHIVPDPEPEGVATVVNGIALCAIHHLAYDRNLLGIDPHGVVHIARRLRDELDGPMLRAGLQGFHGERIQVPARRDDRPDPDRLAIRFAAFEAAS
jgi:putative restriction endonuclease